MKENVSEKHCFQSVGWTFHSSFGLVKYQSTNLTLQKFSLYYTHVYTQVLLFYINSGLNVFDITLRTGGWENFKNFPIFNFNKSLLLTLLYTTC
jgi:hypothetical protein